MATIADDDAKGARYTNDETSPSPPVYEDGSVQEDNAYVYDDSQKLGYTATVFVILNKMIGTGSMYSSRSLAWLDAYLLQSSRLLPVSSQQQDPSVCRFSCGLLAAFSHSAGYPCFWNLVSQSHVQAAKRTIWSASTVTPNTLQHAFLLRRCCCLDFLPATLSLSVAMCCSLLVRKHPMAGRRVV